MAATTHTQETKPKKAPAGNKRGGRAYDDGDHTIELIKTENPKGGDSKERYALYKNNMTLNAYIKACQDKGYTASKARADLKWDVKKGHIKVHPPKKS